MPDIAVTAEPPASSRTTADAIVPWLIALLYVAAEIWLFTLHEPWLDEAQAWLKAIEINDWRHFLVIPGEGHPPVWFWFAKLHSLALDFDQARMVMLGVAALNAVLMARLLGDKPLLMIAFMGTLAVLHSWGFHFRPYPLVLTCLLGALLIDRRGHPIAATWLLALACGLSFIAGWLLAFWLLILLRRGVSMPRLLLPSLLGAAFGASAILSSLGNTDAGQVASVPFGIFNALAFPFSIPFVPPLINAIIAWAVLIAGLRRSPYILGCLLALLLMLGIFGSQVYGLSEWHAAFGIMLALMAFLIARAPMWPLILLLVPQVYFGVEEAVFELRLPSDAGMLMYEAVAADAGDRLDTERNLIAWPDHLLTSTATQLGFHFVSGNNGDVVNDIDWRSRRPRDIATRMLQTMPGPYWLICTRCERPLAWINAAGRPVTIVRPLTVSMTYALTAYRID